MLMCLNRNSNETFLRLVNHYGNDNSPFTYIDNRNSNETFLRLVNHYGNDNSPFTYIDNINILYTNYNANVIFSQ